MDVLELAIEMFQRTLSDTQRRFYGVTLHGGTDVPVLEMWDVEREANWVVGFFANDNQRAKAEQVVRVTVTEGYRKYKYACGAVPAIGGLDGQWIELEWTPTDADEVAYNMSQKQYDANMAAHVELLKAQGLWRLKAQP